MSGAVCERCEQLYAPKANEPAGAPKVCPRCLAVAELLLSADALVEWKKAVEVTSENEAADALTKIIDRTERAAKAVRAP